MASPGAFRRQIFDDLAARLALTSAAMTVTEGLRVRSWQTTLTKASGQPAPARARRRLLQSPCLPRPRGEQDVGDIHKLIGGIQSPRSYLARITTEHSVAEYWYCVIQGHQQQGIDVFELDGQGRVVHQTVWLRPWPTVTILRDAAIAGQLPSLPADFWLLPPPPASCPRAPGQLLTRAESVFLRLWRSRLSPEGQRITRPPTAPVTA